MILSESVIEVLSAGAMYICTEDAFPNRRLVQMVSLLEGRCPELKLSNIRFTDNVFVEHCADIVCLYTVFYSVSSCFFH